MIKKIALWQIATTILLLTNILYGDSIIILSIVVGLVAVGGYKLKSIQSDQKVVIATTSLTAVILAGLVVPAGMSELTRSLGLREQFVLSVIALGIVVILGSSTEFIRRIEASDTDLASM